MELLNTTDLVAGYTVALQRDGRELMVVVVKGTFGMPDQRGQELTLAEEQAALVEADVFVGEPGESAPLYEIDFAPHKPKCDVLLNGSAHAPNGKPAERVKVALRIGPVTKAFEVVGNRVWKNGPLGLTATRPAPFTVMPISYANAFGGIDKSQHDPMKFRWYPTNHAGVGYHESLTIEHTERRPLPNTEELTKPVKSPKGDYRPMAFGPIGRAWQPRPSYAGTYDKKWLDEVAPFLPSDFDDRYYQAAPEDQQIDYPQGGEIVELLNLTPQGYATFQLPETRMPVSFRRRDGSTEVLKAVVDTIVIEPDLRRFMLSWRATLPLRRNVHELRHVVVGKPLRDAESPTREKKKFGSLNEVAAWRRSLIKKT
jgi:hypothetical protein